MDKVLIAEYMPTFGWTKVRKTSKFHGKPLSDGIREIRALRNPAYVLYHGIKYFNHAYGVMNPHLAKKDNHRSIGDVPKLEVNQHV